MILNVIRYRVRAAEDWRTWKFSHAGGRLRSYLCVTAPRAELAAIAAALHYALTGETAPSVQEVALQLSDDGGHTWLVQRRGANVRVLKNGVQLASEDGERELSEALLEQAGVAKLNINRFEIETQGDELRLLRLGGSGASAASVALSVKEVAQAEIAALAQAAAQRMGAPQLIDPRLLTQLCRKLEPLAGSYQELARQYQELTDENQGFVARELPQLAVLAREIELLDEMAEAAAPLLMPGISLKGLKEDLARIDAATSELCAVLGIEPQTPGPAGRDFRAAIAALSRLEAQTKLIRATQQTRQYFAQKLEPLHKRYLQLAESSLVQDRQVAAELESCLASLGLRLQQKDAAEEASHAGGDKPRTWFERFKARQGEAEGRPEGGGHEAFADIETAHMAIAYALKRVQQLSGSLEQAREKHDSALTAIDQGHEQLVRAFGKTKEQWLAVARASQLPEDMDLNQLLQVAVKHGELASLSDTRAELLQKVQRFSARLSKVERLVLDWRQLTGSQNVTDLSNTTILLSEAQGILRYHDNKRKRLEQIRAQAAEVKATTSIRELLKNRRKTLLAAWKEAFAAAGLPACEIHDERCVELFRAANMIRALAVVHAARQPEEQALKFGDGAGEVVLSLYSWDEERTTQKQRLALLHAVEETAEGELRVFLVADRDLAAMLVPAGMGRATLVEKPAIKLPPKAEPRHTERAQGPVASARLPQPLMSERARRALETLTVKK